MPRRTQQTLKEARKTQKQNELKQARKNAKLTQERLKIEAEQEELALIEQNIANKKRAENLLYLVKRNNPQLLKEMHNRECVNPLSMKKGNLYDVAFICDVSGRELGKCNGMLVDTRFEDEIMGCLDDESYIREDDWVTFKLVEKYIPSVKEVSWPTQLEFINSISPGFVSSTLKEMQANKNYAEKEISRIGKKFTHYCVLVNIYPCKRFQIEKRLFASLLETLIGADAAREYADGFYPII